MSERFDLIVIGGGSAARDAANKAGREHGARVALIEKERWGGSCPNVACTPTKAYLVAAELAHDVNALAPKMGVEAGPATVSLARVYAWKESLKKPQEKWVEDLEAAGYATYTGEARLLDANTVQVGEHELEAERILIASGSRTAVPPIEGIEEVGWIDHVSALELTEVPKSLLVVGAGAVGLEFGQIFSRFGSNVTIVDALDRIAPAADAEASAILAAALEEEGIEIATSVFVKHARREGGEVVATIAPRDGSDEYEVRAERILLASGRVPNVEGLNLEAVGVETTKTGITVDEHMHTSVPGIWAAGDVNAVAQFTPVAQYQARIA
ncbi:MAG: NAD(P)/FAD-dependent oxidoreductase, partial [Actinomycetota bacterium]|nr:NAD(P)/FAD-dependent oxidoreductase [Actinomycetota bacterium]